MIHGACGTDPDADPGPVLAAPRRQVRPASCVAAVQRFCRMAQKQLADLLDAVVDAAPVDSAATLASAADADLAWPPAPRWDTLAKLMRVGSRHLVVLISVSRNRDGTGSVGDAGMLLIAPTARRSPSRVGDHVGVN